MSIGRGAARFAMAGALLTGLLAVGAAPAVAADESVRVRLPDKFTAGGSPGSVSVVVARREGQCEAVMVGLTLSLDRLTADRVRVDVAADGAWRPLSVSADGDGAVTVARVAPQRPILCGRKSVTVRYRVAFLAGAPDGKVRVEAEAYGPDGHALERESDTAKVIGGRAAPTPTPSRITPSPVPSLTPETTEEAAPPTADPAALAGQPGQDDEGGFSGFGALVMLLGVMMVGIGAALLVLLLRRNRQAAGGLDHPGRGRLS